LRIFSKNTLREFWEKHANAEQALKVWHKELVDAKWQNFNELKNDYPSASIVNNNRVVFNIKGNNFRIIVKINFDIQVVWIRFIGTHAEYDTIDAKNI
jgi:mRNA interferase HigB